MRADCEHNRTPVERHFGMSEHFCSRSSDGYPRCHQVSKDSTIAMLLDAPRLAVWFFVFFRSPYFGAGRPSTLPRRPASRTALQEHEPSATDAKRDWFNALGESRLERWGQLDANTDEGRGTTAFRYRNTSTAPTSRTSRRNRAVSSSTRPQGLARNE